MSNDKLDIDALLADSARVAAEFDAEENKVEDWESNQADLQDLKLLLHQRLQHHGVLSQLRVF